MTTQDVSKPGKVERKTYSVPEAGRVLGIGRNAAYQAVKNKEIESIKVGGRIVVPIQAIEKMLAGVAH